MHADCIEQTDFVLKLYLYTLVPLGIGVFNMLYQAGRVTFYGESFFGGTAFKW